MTDICEGCKREVKNWVTKKEATGEFEVCPHCHRRNDGLGQLQDRFSL
jgi:hypothetical protein